MSKLRVIHNNIADAATITASTTATGYAVSNLQTDFKSSWHRSTGTTVTYTLNWASAQTVAGIVLPCTNLTSSATILVKFYSQPNATNQLNLLEPAVSACVNSPIKAWIDAGVVPTGNYFQLGALSKTSWWLNTPYTTVRSMEIILTDTTNPAGFIDCARIICGNYWQPQYSVDRSGLSITSNDTSESVRTDAGSFVSDRGFVHDKLQFSLGTLLDSDRDTLIDIFSISGTNKYLLFSVFPDENNSKTEQLYTVYGKRQNSDIQYVLPGFNSHQVQIDGW